MLVFYQCKNFFYLSESILLRKYTIPVPLLKAKGKRSTHVTISGASVCNAKRVIAKLIELRFQPAGINIDKYFMMR
jgi:hypothetical protein